MSSIFREVIFGKSEFSANTPVLDTQYKYLGSQNNNLFYLFNDQLNYALTYYFAESETTKSNVDKFLINSLMKPIIKKLLYYNADK